MNKLVYLTLLVALVYIGFTDVGVTAQAESRLGSARLSSRVKATNGTAQPFELVKPAFDMYGHALQLYEETCMSESEPLSVRDGVQVPDKLELDQGYNSEKSTCSSPDTTVEDFFGHEQKGGLKTFTLSRAGTYATNRNTLEGRKSAPLNTQDFSESWRTVEDDLQSRLNTTKLRKTPLWKKTWFSLLCYTFVSLHLVAAILSTAAYFAFVKPNIVLKGQILSPSPMEPLNYQRFDNITTNWTSLYDYSLS